MIVLNVTAYDNHAGIEATWLERSESVPTGTEGDVTSSPRAETQIHCQSYHPTQMAMFRAQAATYGTPLDDYTALIAAIEAAYVPPEPEPIPVPQVVSARQGKLALLAAGLLDEVDAAVAQAGRATQIEWEYATELRRDWATLAALQAAMGLPDAQVDELFVLASTL